MKSVFVLAVAYNFGLLFDNFDDANLVVVVLLFYKLNDKSGGGGVA